MIQKFKAIQSRNNSMIKLISASMDGIIRIWDFHSSKLLQKFTISNNSLYSFCIHNEKEIFISSNNNIILLNIQTGKIIKKISGFNNWICCIKLIEHMKYGKCIISQGIKNEQVKLWKISDIL